MKKIITVLIMFLVLTACSSSGESNSSNEQKMEVIETITTTDNSFIYSSPDSNSKLDEEVKSDESLDIYQKIETDDTTWYQIGKDKWIKEDKIPSLTSAQNWEEMAKIMTNGYWLSIPDYTPENKQDSQRWFGKDITIFNTFNLGSESDKTPLEYCDFKAGEKGLGITSVFSSKRYYGSIDYEKDPDPFILQYKYVEDDVNNKKVLLTPYTCNDAGNPDNTIDYSDIENGILRIRSEYSVCYGDCLSSNGCHPEEFTTLSSSPSYETTALAYNYYGYSNTKNVVFTFTLYYYPTLEKAMEAFGDGSFGEIEVLAKTVNVRDDSFVNENKDNKVGQVKQGEKYKVYAIQDGATHRESYIWYLIGNEQWVADDGTWMKYTPYEFKYR